MKTRGFTLLEVMVSLSILALALTAAAGVTANAFEASNYARGVTVATLLARSKMLDIEQTLVKDGFSENDQEDDGDFSDEGFESVRWVSTVRKVEMDVGQLIGGMFGGEGGEIDSEKLPEQLQGYLGALGGGAGGAGDLAGLAGQAGAAGGAGDLTQLLGGGQMENMFKQVGETLKNSIREITLEIKWGKGPNEETIKFVQYVTTTGRLSFKPPANPALEALTPGGRTTDNAVPATLPDGSPNPALQNGKLSTGGSGGGK
jgi:general secretion pathway protein I